MALFSLLTHSPQPLEGFKQWFEEATLKEINNPQAMSLATIGKNGLPNIRIVLFKGFYKDGLCFYTNLKSVKAMELKKNPLCALCFLWKSLMRQVRIRGKAHLLPEAENDKYFASRPINSQIGALVSKQSEPLASQEELHKSYEEQKQRLPIKRPTHWGGFFLKPQEIEFWQEGNNRLHTRRYYLQEKNGNWKSQLLYP